MLLNAIQRGNMQVVWRKKKNGRKKKKKEKRRRKKNPQNLQMAFFSVFVMRKKKVEKKRSGALQTKQANPGFWRRILAAQGIAMVLHVGTGCCQAASCSCLMKSCFDSSSVGSFWSKDQSNQLFMRQEHLAAWQQPVPDGIRLQSNPVLY